MVCGNGVVLHGVVLRCVGVYRLGMCHIVGVVVAAACPGCVRSRACCCDVWV